jgi:hypothetical protein
MGPRCDFIATVDHSNAATTRLYEYVDEPTLQKAVEAIPALDSWPAGKDGIPINAALVPS